MPKITHKKWIFEYLCEKYTTNDTFENNMTNTADNQTPQLLILPNHVGVVHKTTGLRDYLISLTPITM